MKMSQTDQNVDFSNELLDLETIISQNTLQSILGQHEIANIADEILARRNSQTNSLLETATLETSSNRQESVVSNEIEPLLLDLSQLFVRIQANFDALYEMNLRLKEQLSMAVANNCISQIGEIGCSTNSVENHESNGDQSSMCEICKRCFKNKVGLSMHKYKSHSKPKKSISTNGSNIQKIRGELQFECDNCNTILKSRKGLIAHQKTCVNTGASDIRKSSRAFDVFFAKSKVECHICQKKFWSNSTLKRHMRFH